MKKTIAIVLMTLATAAFGDVTITRTAVPGAIVTEVIKTTPTMPGKPSGIDDSNVRYVGYKGTAKRKVRKMCTGFVVKKDNSKVTKPAKPKPKLTYKSKLQLLQQKDEIRMEKPMAMDFQKQIEDLQKINNRNARLRN